MPESTDRFLGWLADRVGEVEPVEPLVEAQPKGCRNTTAPRASSTRAHHGSSRSSESSTSPANDEISMPARPRPRIASSKCSSRIRVGCCRGTSPSPVSRSGANATCSAMSRVASIAVHTRDLLGPRIEVVRRGAHPLTVDTLRVHRGEPHVHVGELRDARAHHRAGDGEARGAVSAQLERRGIPHLLRRAALDLGLQLPAVKQVGVYRIDRHRRAPPCGGRCRRSGRPRRRHGCPSICHWPSCTEASTTAGRAAAGGHGMRPRGCSSSVSAATSSSVEHERILEGLRRALRDGGRAAVRGIADDDDPAAIPGAVTGAR